MPVFHKHRLIHIHIPKTAGTTIQRFFYKAGDMKWGPASWVGAAKANGRWFEYQHLSLMELRSLSGSLFPGFSSFAVVRDPYTRLFSDYVWRQAVREMYPKAPVRFFDSLDEFIEAIPKDMESRWSEHILSAGQDWANFLIHVRPQYQFVFDRQDNLIVDDILKYERLENELGVFLARFGMNPGTVVAPHITDPGEHFNRRQLDIVNEIYRRDFEGFSYARL